MTVRNPLSDICIWKALHYLCLSGNHYKWTICLLCIFHWNICSPGLWNQYLMSSFKGGRSGNRGSCAQPCRQKYRLSCLNSEDYYLSPKDLSLYDHLKEIAELNISCIKIEGRMRSKEY